jgi:methyl acetate hydrolase
MRLRNTLWLPASVVLAAVFCAASRSAETPPKTGFSAIDAVLEAGVRQRRAPGVVAIVVNKEQVIYLGAAGMMNSRTRKVMRKDAIFRIASMTKPFTAVAVMMLQEQGKLRIDDPVAKYLPALKNIEVVDSYDEVTGTYTTRQPSQELRIRHLLSNTSGFGYAFSSPMLKVIRDRTGKPTEALPLLHDPGSRWTYGMSAKLLGQIVEKVSGVGLDQFFNSRIFQPLGLQDTFYLVPSAKLSRVATTNHRDGKGGFVETANPSRLGSRAAGDGGLFSTAADYATFLQMLLNEGKWRQTTLLTKESVRTMTENQIGDIFVQTQHTTDPAQSKDFPFNAGRDKFGFAFQIATAPDGNVGNTGSAGSAWDSDLRSPGSYSWAGSYNTHFWVDPKRQVAAVLLMQVTPFYDDGAMDLLKEFELAVGRNLPSATN